MARRSEAEWAIEKRLCRDDAHYLIFDSGFTLTKDEHDIDNPVKPFPDIPYLRVLLDCLLVSGGITNPESAKYARFEMGPQFLQELHDSGMFFVEKSRQLLVTWLVCAYLLWRARSKQHQLLLVQSKREDDANSLVYVKDATVARISFMESHLPNELKQVKFPADTTTGVIYFPNGSKIWAIPEGGHIIRSNTPSVVFSDEAAFQPEFDHAFTAALPAVKHGGQLICVSSAEPGTFQQLVESP